MTDAPLPPAVTETHVSVVAFIGERAYKLLKPIRNDFLDYSTPEARQAAVQAELELNRRLSPDVYLGTAAIEEQGRIVDQMLVMRRLPPDRRLSEIVRRPGWEEPVRQVARQVAGFHSSLAPLTDVADIAGREAVVGNWEDNDATMAPFVGSVLDEATAVRATTLAHRYLASRKELFDRRIEDGFIRDGHGDLTAEDIFQLDDGPRILDCLAFDRRLRVSDVLADIAFLAMDLERLAGPEPARRLMSWYGEFSGEHHPTSLAHHYVAYRAHVRAKVACLGHAQGQDGADKLARAYLDLCLGHLELATVRLVLIGGGPGTGKTTLATRLSDELRWPALNSDEVRKDITGHGHQERLSAPLDEGLYAPGVSDETYRTLLERAHILLTGGESVILDASWSNGRHRQLARELAASAGADLVEFDCQAPAEVARQRIRQRLSSSTGASDATPDLVEVATARRQPWPTAIVLDTTADTEHQMFQAVTRIRHAPSQSTMDQPTTSQSTTTPG